MPLSPRSPPPTNCSECPKIKFHTTTLQSRCTEHHCPICGLPLLHPSELADFIAGRHDPGEFLTRYQWLTQITTLCDPDSEYDYLRAQAQDYQQQKKKKRTNMKADSPDNGDARPSFRLKDRRPILELSVAHVCKNVFQINQAPPELEYDAYSAFYAAAFSDNAVYPTALHADPAHSLVGHYFEATEPHHASFCSSSSSGSSSGRSNNNNNNNNNNININDFPHKFFPVHTKCLDIAKQVFRIGRNHHLHDTRGLLTAVQWRIDVAKSLGLRRTCVPALSPNYSLVSNNHYLTHTEMRDEEFLAEAVDPDDIRGVTECLLGNLRTTEVRPVDEETRKFRQLFAGLCLEVRAHIIRMTVLTWDSNLVSSRTLPQSFWREFFNSHIPFLPFLDAAAINAVDASSLSPGGSYEWDWEALVHQVWRDFTVTEREQVEVEMEAESDVVVAEHVWQTSVVAFGGGLRGMLGGLVNRRRIWQLVEEMHVGDVLMEKLADGEAEAEVETGTETEDMVEGVTANINSLILATDYQEPQISSIPPSEMPRIYDRSGHPTAPDQWMPAVDLRPYCRREGQVVVRPELLEDGREMASVEEALGEIERYWKGS